MNTSEEEVPYQAYLNAISGSYQSPISYQRSSDPSLLPNHVSNQALTYSNSTKSPWGLSSGAIGAVGPVEEALMHERESFRSMQAQIKKESRELQASYEGHVKSLEQQLSQALLGSAPLALIVTVILSLS